jgi:GTP-binding protein
MAELHPLPLVAIVGKPNVGKSALFNRLIRQRKAIVAEEPGVTRDINYGVVFSQGHQYRLADSAGFVSTRSEIALITRSHNMRLIEEASLLVFTCEVGSLDSADLELAESIRRSGRPCILTVNKVDNEKLEEQIFDFYELGFDTPVPVSASHGRNIAQLEGRIAEHLFGAESPQFRGSDSEKSSKELGIEEYTIDVAIVGKPNVGKSSLLNMMVRKNRAIVLPEPGTTRDSLDEIVEFQGHTLRFIDTAGLRKYRKIRESVEYYSTLRSERAIREATVCVLVLDATEGISSQDKKIAWIIAGARRGLIVAANKWDLMTDRKESSFVEEIYHHFPHASFADVVPISARNGYNKIRLLKNIVKVYNNYHSVVRTAELNNFISGLSPGGSYIKYGYQRGTAPPRFEFFIRDMQSDDTGFKRYLANVLRKRFDLSGVPVEISLRKK